mgnify:CR=1 FL=1
MPTAISTDFLSKRSKQIEKQLYILLRSSLFFLEALNIRATIRAKKAMTPMAAAIHSSQRGSLSSVKAFIRILVFPSALTSFHSFPSFETKL